MRDSWREDVLKTLDDVSMRVEHLRVLVQGGPSDADVRGLSGD